MATEILDGTGNDYRAEVTSDNRLASDSISRDQLEYGILKGYGFNVSTGTINLTTNGESAVGYFKYTGNKTLVIKEILVILQASTGGAGTSIIKLIKNPSTGTIIDNAIPVTSAQNRDFGSAYLLQAIAYKGAEGNTFTDGNIFSLTTRAAAAEIVAFDAAPIVLRKGNSIGVTFTPASGNTSQDIVIAGTVYEEQTGII